jgi:hypothetical protein
MKSGVGRFRAFFLRRILPLAKFAGLTMMRKTKTLFKATGGNPRWRVFAAS